jgi:hypothetical protein
MKTQNATFAVFIAWVAFSAQAAFAIDHGNLDEGRPLRLEDAYTIAHGEITLETGVGYQSPREGSGQFIFPVAVLWGAYPNFHVEIGTALFTSPRQVEGPRHSGDLRLGALYNLNQETLTLPAFGIKAEAILPTGTDSSGTDFELKGIITKGIGRLSFHLNAGYEFIGSPEPGWRDGGYRLVFGSSYPVGAPMYTRTTILADIFFDQSHRRGERETAGVEAGFRHQLTERSVLDAGIGTEVRGARDRADFFVTAGLSTAF